MISTTSSIHPLAPTCNRICIAALALIASVCLLSAGPLDPPAGPVASTSKVLAEIEPRTAVNAVNTPGDATNLFKITQPGSYYLTGNITGVAGKHGILIGASGVTLDLNGFEVSGVAGMGAFSGVRSAPAILYNTVKVRNGTVRNWGSRGVDLLTPNSSVWNVQASGNAGTGISIGEASVVSGCGSFQNGGDGVNGGFLSTVTGCVITSNLGSGVVSIGSLWLNGCTIGSNSGYGVNVTGSSNAIVDCHVGSNSLGGIKCGSGCVVRDNSVGASGGPGIQCTGRTVVMNNTCSGGVRGVQTQTSRNVVVGNTCRENTIDWDLSINTIYGTIIDGRDSGNGSINGFSDSGTIGTSDHWVNISQ